MRVPDVYIRYMQVSTHPVAIVIVIDRINEQIRLGWEVRNVLEASLRVAKSAVRMSNGIRFDALYVGMHCTMSSDHLLFTCVCIT